MINVSIRRFREEQWMDNPRPSPDDPDFFLRPVASLVRNAFSGPPEDRAVYLAQCLATAKAIVRMCLELAPTFFPDATTAQVVAFMSENMVQGCNRVAQLAGLDA